MTPAAIDTLSTVGVGILCFVLGVIALATFFTIMNKLGTGATPETLAVRGVLKKDTWVTVHMSGAETFDQVRFIGFTNKADFKTHLPYDLDGMVILEDAEGKRFLVRAKSIRMITIVPTNEEVKANTA